MIDFAGLLTLTVNVNATIEQTAGWLARRLPANEREELLEDLAAVKWLLWNGQADRAIELIGRLFR